MQCDLAPRNRADCDAFNRFHFQRLAAVRQATGGGLTPKVGNEPLTVYEAEFTRQVARNRSASPMGASSARPLTAATHGQRDLSPDASPPAFRPATAHPVTRRRSMSAAPEHHHAGYQGDAQAPAQMQAGPEVHGFDGRRSVPLEADQGVPSPEHFVSAPAQNQHMHRSSPETQTARPSAPMHAAPQTVPCSPVNLPPAQCQDGVHADKHVTFQPMASYEQHAMHDAGVFQHQHAAGNFHPGSTAAPSPQPHAHTQSQSLAPGMEHAGHSITFRADEWQEAQAAHAQATAQNFNKSPTPLQHTTMHDGNAGTPEDMHAEQKHVFEAPDQLFENVLLAEKIASGALGEPVMQQRARGRSPERADAGPGDENAQPCNRGVRTLVTTCTCIDNGTLDAADPQQVICQETGHIPR